MSKQGLPPGMGDMGGLLKQAQQMQKSLAKVQEELKERIVEEQAGGGMVVAQVSGAKELVALKIDGKGLGIEMDDDDREMLEDLCIAAVNAAMKKAEELSKKEMEKVTGGLNLPGMM